MLLSQESRQARSPSLRCLRRRGRIEFWRAKLSNVSFGSLTRPTGPIQSHPSFAKDHVVTGGYPDSRLSVWNPAVAVAPEPPRLLTTRPASRSSLSLGHCSVSVASRSRPGRVPACRPTGRVTSVACDPPQIRRARGTCAREGRAVRSDPRLGRTRCGCCLRLLSAVAACGCCLRLLSAVRCRAVLSRSNSPVVPDRVAVVVRSPMLSRSAVQYSPLSQ